jgi:hypothetical protein
MPIRMLLLLIAGLVATVKFASLMALIVIGLVVALRDKPAARAV